MGGLRLDTTVTLGNIIQIAGFFIVAIAFWQRMNFTLNTLVADFKEHKSDDTTQFTKVTMQLDSISKDVNQIIGAQRVVPVKRL